MYFHCGTSQLTGHKGIWIGSFSCTFHERLKGSTGWDRTIALKWQNTLFVWSAVAELGWFAIFLTYKKYP